jgi:hypothetical protein
VENLALLDLPVMGWEGQVGGLFRRKISCNSADTADAGPICDGATDDGANCNQPSGRSPPAAMGICQSGLGRRGGDRDTERDCCHGRNYKEGIGHRAPMSSRRLF